MNISTKLIERCHLQFDPTILNDLGIESVSDFKNLSQIEVTPGLMDKLDDCQFFFDLTRITDAYRLKVLYFTMTVGLVLNLFVLAVLALDKTKTASDIYLSSISLGDVCICVGTFVATWLFNAYRNVFVFILGNIIGDLGKIPRIYSAPPPPPPPKCFS